MMTSRIDKAVAFVSACLATAFVSLWLPENNEPLRVGLSFFVFCVLATPVFQWRHFWLLPVGGLVAAAAALVPMSGHVQLLLPLLIAIGLVAQFLRRSSQSKV